MTAGKFILICIMCFVSGGCLSVLITVCAFRPSRKVLAGWFAYFAICLSLAYIIGKAVLL